MSPISPLAPASFPELPTVAGVELHTLDANLRYSGRPDLFLAVMPEGTTVGGVFTKSACASGPVDWCKEILPEGTARAVVCNAGNANAFTGAAGAASVHAEVETLSAALRVPADQIYVASTGVIGEPLNDGQMTTALGQLVATDAATWTDAAKAITTTDTFIKGAVADVPGSHVVGNVVGIAKGSGMIAPDMATMLSFLFTDVAATSEALQQAVTEAVGESFNRITVDSDTSTSDTVLLFATGAAGNEKLCTLYIFVKPSTILFLCSHIRLTRLEVTPTYNVPFFLLANI